MSTAAVAAERVDGFPADVAVVGVGAVANVELAKDAGLPCADGVVVDLAARTADPAIFAIGDVTHRPLPLYGRDMRLESVPNALEQAKHFTAATDVTALAITKLDGTAKGGVVLAIANQFRIPVKFIGVGEKMEDLLVFDKHEFVDSLFKLEN